MLNFAVGPVPETDEVLEMGSKPTPYFRTSAFSKLMLESERILCSLANAPEESRAVFLTNSGTGAMEAAVMGTLDPKTDRALVVDGGSFGHRFVRLLELHGIPYDVVSLIYGQPLCEEDLAPYEGGNYTAFLVNLGETSQGVLYDASMIGEFCDRNSLFLIVDGISSFLADPFDMTAMGAGVLITDSQKALACPPGVAPMLLSPEALERIRRVRQTCMYLDLNDLLANGVRGQTPFTPAVRILLQINARLRKIERDGGADVEVKRCATIASDFRRRLCEANLPLEMRLASPSNAVTFITTKGFSAIRVFEELQDRYGIWVCPNGGPNADTSFRVGHIGNHSISDNEQLVAALCDLQRSGLMGIDGLA